MRIAVANWSNRHVGGAETYVAQVVRALDGAGHDVLFWHEQNGPADRDAIELPPRVSSRGFDATSDDGVRVLRDWQPEVLFVQGLVEPALERTLLAVAPAVLFAHGYYGTCISGSKTQTFPAIHPCERRFGAQCLAQFYPKRCGGLSPVTMWVEYRRQSAHLANLASYQGVVTFSEHMRREYLRHDVPPDRVHRVPPIATRSVGDALAHPDEPRPGGYRLIYAGRLDVLKGCRVLVESLAAVQATTGKAVELIVAGDGPDMGRCRTAAAAVSAANPNVSVTFAGWVSREKSSALLATTDALVMPSLWPEPLGLSGLEAGQLGIPVAAFAVGGVPEWLEDGVNGALAPGDALTPAALATAIVRALTDPGIRTGARAPSRSSRAVSVQQHLDHLMPILRRAAGVRKAFAQEAVVR